MSLFTDEVFTGNSTALFTCLDRVSSATRDAIPNSLTEAALSQWQVDVARYLKRHVSLQLLDERKLSCPTGVCAIHSLGD